LLHGCRRQFLNRGLLDEIRLRLVPIILGAGARLIDGVNADVRLVPREAQNAPGVTYLIYAVEPRPRTGSERFGRLTPSAPTDENER
jgi:hypothetical protein